MRRIARDVLCRGQGVGRRRTTRRRGGCEELLARVGADPRHTPRQQVCQRVECRQRGRLRTIQRILDHRPQAAGREVHQIRHIPCGDPQAERVPFDRGAIDELRVRPHRGDRRQLIDHDAGRRFTAQHRHQRNAVVVAARLVSRGFAALCNQVKTRVLCRSGGRVDREAAIGTGSRPAQLHRGNRRRGPERYSRALDRRAATENLAADRLGQRAIRARENFALAVRHQRSPS